MSQRTVGDPEETWPNKLGLGSYLGVWQQEKGKNILVRTYMLGDIGKARKFTSAGVRDLTRY